MPEGRPRHVLCLDVDDTVYLERDYVRSGFSAVSRWVAAELGIEGFFERSWAAFEAGSRGRIFNEVLDDLGAPDDKDLIGRLVAVYREHTPEIAMQPDAAACLPELAARYRLAVISDGPVASQRAKVEALGMPAIADPVILTAELGEGFGKPHRRAFEMVMAHHGVKGASCVYVADNPAKDFRGPWRLGWRTVRIRRPLSLHAAAGSGEDVEAELPDMSGLPALLEKNWRDDV